MSWGLEEEKASKELTVREELQAQYDYLPQLEEIVGKTFPIAFGLGIAFAMLGNFSGVTSIEEFGIGIVIILLVAIVMVAMHLNNTRYKYFKELYFDKKREIQELKYIYGQK